MLKGAVARRYASAIFEIAKERGDLDQWREALGAMRDVLTTPQVALFLENPKVSFDKKKEVVDSVMPDLAPLQRNLLYLLIDKRRTEIVDSVSTEYEALLNDYRGIAYADVTTAVPLSAPEEVALADKLSRLSGKEIRLRSSVDPAIIGGVVARIGDRLIDGSVKGRLTALRQRMVGAAL
jgi:F-type H+-transporting ATPase subunit delta